MSAEKESAARKRKWYTQSFKEEWVEDVEFKDWLERDKNSKDNSFCKCCKTTLKNANKSMLLQHKKSGKHRTHFKDIKSTVEVAQFFSEPSLSEGEKVAKAELLIAGYFIEHNIPFSHVGDLTEVCARAFPDSRIASKLSLKRTKLSYLIRDGIAFDEKTRITNICRKQKFSILIDESTDIAMTQVLAVVVRYFDEEKRDVADALLDTVEVESGTAQNLYSAVKTLLMESSIPFGNIIGYGSNCSTTMGVGSEFQKLLTEDIPSVFILGCVCHSFALCASDAVKVLPLYLEGLLKDVSSYFSHSGRLRDFETIQDVLNIKHVKIPKLSQTRWLSRENVIAAILDLYDALTLYFQSEIKTDKIDGAKRIYDVLVKQGTKHILIFLQYIINKVNTLNLEFQSEHFVLHILYLHVSAEYKSILSCFIKEEILALNKISEIDPSNKNHHKHIDDIYLGGRTMAHLIQDPFLNNISKQQFKTDCLKFLVELCLQIKERFPFTEDGVISKLKILDPVIALDVKQSPESIAQLAAHFPSIVREEELDALDDQWRCFRLSGDSLPLSYKYIPEYWKKLNDIKDGLNNSKFPLLSRFFNCLTVLPHSSACVERIFSNMNCAKTKAKDCLKAETTKDRLFAKQHIVNCAGCTKWEPNKQLIKSVEDGTVKRRYTKRISRLKECEKVTLHKESYIKQFLK